LLSSKRNTSLKSISNSLSLFITHSISSPPIDIRKWV